MSILFTALGIGCMGWVYGYILFYSLKRHFPPMSDDPLPINQIVLLLAAFGAGGTIGAVFIALEGVNYFGPYGIGLFVGVVTNIVISRRIEILAQKK